MQETWVWSLDQEDPLEKEMATHSSILAWEMPWTEEPSGLQFLGFQRVGHDRVTEQQWHFSVLCIVGCWEYSWCPPTGYQQHHLLLFPLLSQPWLPKTPPGLASVLWVRQPLTPTKGKYAVCITSPTASTHTAFSMAGARGGQRASAHGGNTPGRGRQLMEERCLPCHHSVISRF